MDEVAALVNQLIKSFSIFSCLGKNKAHLLQAVLHPLGRLSSIAHQIEDDAISFSLASERSDFVGCVAVVQVKKVW